MLEFGSDFQWLSFILVSSFRIFASFRAGSRSRGPVAGHVIRWNSGSHHGKHAHGRIVETDFWNFASRLLGQLLGKVDKDGEVMVEIQSLVLICRDRVLGPEDVNILANFGWSGAERYHGAYGYYQWLCIAYDSFAFVAVFDHFDGIFHKYLLY